MDKLHKALQHMPNRKDPGPEGFPAEFHKEFWPLLAPVLKLKSLLVDSPLR